MEAYRFYLQNDFRTKLHIIYTIICIPGLIIHEASHIIFAFILGVKIHDVRIPYFFKVEGDTLRTCKVAVHTSIKDSTWGYISVIITSTSPLITAIILMCINPWLMVWVLISWKTFIMSPGDVRVLKEYLNLLRQKLWVK